MFIRCCNSSGESANVHPVFTSCYSSLISSSMIIYAYWVDLKILLNYGRQIHTRCRKRSLLQKAAIAKIRNRPLQQRAALAKNHVNIKYKPTKP